MNLPQILIISAIFGLLVYGGLKLSTHETRERLAVFALNWLHPACWAVRLRRLRSLPWLAIILGAIGLAMACLIGAAVWSVSKEGGRF